MQQAYSLALFSDLGLTGHPGVKNDGQIGNETILDPNTDGISRLGKEILIPGRCFLVRCSDRRADPAMKEIEARCPHHIHSSMLGGPNFLRHRAPRHHQDTMLHQIETAVEVDQVDTVVLIPHSDCKALDPSERLRSIYDQPAFFQELAEQQEGFIRRRCRAISSVVHLAITFKGTFWFKA